MSYLPSSDRFENQQQEEGSEVSFWTENYPKLRRYCHFLAQNKWDGDDIAQEAYIKAQKYADNPQKMSTALLNKIAYNHWLDLIRKRKNETIEVIPELAANTPFNDVTSTVDMLLKQFTPKQAVIFLLKEGFQYQNKEIADIIDTTEIAVKAILHRTKKRLEKTNGAVSFEAFWDEKEREQFGELFYEALKTQDPSILIQTISSSKIETPKLMMKTHSPSSTLCMAA